MRTGHRRRTGATLTGRGERPVPRPVAATGQAEWGSDVVVDLLRGCGIDYIAVNPGRDLSGAPRLAGELRGQPRAPRSSCARTRRSRSPSRTATRAPPGKPMAAAVHNMVGLQHASMAIYNAWCDRSPIIVMGGTGPDGRDGPAALDRLGAHRARAGQPGARLREVGRPAGHRRGGAGVASCAPTGWPPRSPRGRSISATTPASRRARLAAPLPAGGRSLSGAAADSGAGGGIRDDDPVAPGGPDAGDRRRHGGASRGGLSRARRARRAAGDPGAGPARAPQLPGPAPLEPDRACTRG